MSIVMEKIPRVTFDLNPVAVCDQCGKQEALVLPEPTGATSHRAYYGETYPLGWVRASEVSEGLNVQAPAYCSWACVAAYASSRVPVPA